MLGAISRLRASDLASAMNRAARDALAGDVADQEAEPRLVQHEGVVEVAADVAGRLKHGVDVDAPPTGCASSLPRQQHAGLDFGGGGEFAGAVRAAFSRSLSSAARSRACSAPAFHEQSRHHRRGSRRGRRQDRQRVEQQAGLEAVPARAQRRGDHARPGDGQDARPATSSNRRPGRQREQQAEAPFRPCRLGRPAQALAAQNVVDGLGLHEHAIGLAAARRVHHVRRAGAGEADQHDLALEQVVGQALAEQIRRRRGPGLAPVAEAQGELSVGRRRHLPVADLDRRQTTVDRGQIDPVDALGHADQLGGEAGRRRAGDAGDQRRPPHQAIIVRVAVDQAVAERGAIEQRQVGDGARKGR